MGGRSMHTQSGGLSWLENKAQTLSLFKNLCYCLKHQKSQCSLVTPIIPVWLWMQSLHLPAWAQLSFFPEVIDWVEQVEYVTEVSKFRDPFCVTEMCCQWGCFSKIFSQCGDPHSEATSLTRVVKPRSHSVMAATPSEHIQTQNDQFSVPDIWSFRGLNSSAAVVLIGHKSAHNTVSCTSSWKYLPQKQALASLPQLHLRSSGVKILIRSKQPRCFTCAVHSRLHTPVRIYCHHWSDRRRSSGGHASDGEWL